MLATRPIWIVSGNFSTWYSRASVFLQLDDTGDLDCESISDPLWGLRWAVGSRDLCNLSIYIYICTETERMIFSLF